MNSFKRHFRGFCWDYLWLLVVCFFITERNNLTINTGKNTLADAYRLKNKFLMGTQRKIISALTLLFTVMRTEQSGFIPVLPLTRKCWSLPE